MTAFDRIERRMPELFDELGAAGVPDYFDDMLRQTARTRQRPAWSALERWLPMGEIARTLPVRPVPWRLLVGAAAIVLLVIAAGLLYAGSRQHALPAPFGFARTGPMLIGTADGDIVRYDPATGATTPVITGPTRDTGPTFSYDGRRFAFDRGLVGASSLYVANADGSDVRQLTGPGDELRWFEWLPNSDRVLVVTATSTSVGTMSIVDLVSGATTSVPLGRVLDVQTAFWRPAHEQIVFTTNTGEMFRSFWVVNADGSGLRQIDTYARAINDPTMTPDGSLIAYATWEATQPEGRIRVVDIDTGGDHEVTRPDDFTYQSPTFSPDGIHLLLFAFYGNTDPAQAKVATLDIRDGSSVLMGPTSGNPQPGVLWSPDGKQILAEYDFTPKVTWLFNADGTNGHVAPFSTIENEGATWQRVGD
jgi:TolB protein